MSEPDRSTSRSAARRSWDGEPDARGFEAGLEPDRASEPPEGAPNVLLVSSTMRGSESEHVRRSDPYAELHAHRRGGLKYNRFHVTALCSPTRAALLTGRNNHAVGFGSVGEFAGGFPGYSASLPRDCAPLPASCATTATAPRRSGSGT